MGIPDIDKLNRVDNYGDPLISNQIKFSCHSFFDYGLLNAGAFTNVRIPTGTFATGVGSHQSPGYVLRPARDPRQSDSSGRIWEAFRGNWVWESNINYSQQPITISGVYVNNNFIPTGTVGSSGFKISYPEGKIIFNSAIPTTSEVKCEFSYKNVKIDMADSPWFQAVQFDSLRADSPQFQQTVGSGMWDILSQNRVQLPAIVIESSPRVLLAPYELGNLSRIHKQEISFHIIAQTPYDRDQLHDIIINQYDRVIWGIDKKKMLSDNVWPLSSDGSINPSGLNYRQAIDSVTYRWGKIIFDQIRSAEINGRPPMYMAVVKALMSIQGY